MVYRWLRPLPPSEAEKLLNKWFGPTSRATVYTFDEAMNWVGAYEDLLQKGFKALIFKANSTVLINLVRKTGVNFGNEKFLVLAVVSNTWSGESGSFKDIYRSSVVKYDRLDERFEDELSEGNGVMKIGA